MSQDSYRNLTMPLNSATLNEKMRESPEMEKEGVGKMTGGDGIV